MLLKRPIIIITIFFILGILTSSNIYSNISGICIIFLISLILIVLTKNFDLRIKVVIFITISFFVAGYLEHFYFEKTINEKFQNYIGEDISIEGSIDSAPQSKTNTVDYILRTKYVISKKGIQPLDGKILLSTQKKEHTKFIEYGKSIIVKGSLQELKRKSNPKGFDYKEYLAVYDVSSRMFVKSKDIVLTKNNDGNFLVKLGLDLRAEMVRTIYEYIPDIQAGLLSGILIGYRDGLPDYIKDAFTIAGLTHIMAVSGANVLFVMLPCLFILRKLRVKNIYANILTILVLGLFVLVTGFEASVLRAVVMADIILIGKILRRDGDIYNSIAFSALLILMYNPFILFNIGFLLSYGATISLIVLYKKFEACFDIRYLPKIIKETLAGTMAAQIGVIPIIVYYFNNISLISVLTNLIVVPFTALVTVGGFAMVILGQINFFIVEYIVIFIGKILNFILIYILLVTKYSSAFSFASIKMSTPSIFEIILYYSFIIYIFFIIPKISIKIGLKYLAVALSICILTYGINSVIPSNLKVVFLDVGEGDSIFIETRHKKTILIDGGGYLNLMERKRTKGEYVVNPFLYDYGVSKIDVIISSHSDADHLAGLFDVMEEFEVEKFIIPNVEYDKMYEKARKIAVAKNINVITCEKDDVIRFDNETYMKVLNPPKEEEFQESYENNASLVLKLCYNDTSFLFTGDISKEAEDLMINSNIDLTADVLKVAHHGSSSSSTQGFLDKANPLIAVVSVGKNNYGHPSKDVLDRVLKMGTKIYRTDTEGAIIIESDGTDIWVKKTIR